MPNNSIQLWSPDTCGCVIHLAYDDTLPPESRVFTPVTEDEAEAIVQARRDRGERNINPNRQPPAKLCPAHAHLGHTPARHAQVLDENRRKNMALAEIQKLVPTLKPEEYKWSFDANRNLQIDLPTLNLSLAEKKDIQVALNTRFGKDKATIR